MTGQDKKTPMLEISNLCKEYTGEQGRVVRALHDVSLTCSRGEFVTLLGPTGCGKTTLLRLIAGLEESDGGEVLIDGVTPQESRNRIGFVFQQNALFPWRNILENVMFGLEIRNWNEKSARTRAMECLEMVELSHAANAYPYELSGGMQQRGAIARALAPSPDLLLMDEPYGALDEKTRRNLQDRLLQLWEDAGITVVFVTHNIEEAVYLSQRVITLGIDPGRVVSDYPIELPYKRDKFSSEFIKHLLAVRARFEELV